MMEIRDRRFQEVVRHRQMDDVCGMQTYDKDLGALPQQPGALH